ncbi:MAG: hypothetical protein ACR2FG_13880 [Marmoricola sp.]
MSLTAAVLIATPVLAFAGSLLGSFLTRRAARELDRWRKREETMRMLRWAVDLGVNVDDDRRKAGLAVLTALLRSPLLDIDDVGMVSTMTTYVARSRTLARGDNE